MQLPSRSRLPGEHPYRSRGQGLVEFALVLPVLLIVLLFAIDFGRAFYSWVILQNASRIGANYAALNPELWENSPAAIPAEYLALVTDDYGGLGCDPLVPPVFADGADGPSGAGQTPDTDFDVGDTVTVTLTCPFSPLTPIISGIVGNTFQLGATSEFRIRSGDVAGLTNPPPIPKPCFVVPDLTLEAGGPETVGQARDEWDAAGFIGAFTPNGNNAETVLGQDLTADTCVPRDTPITVTHT